MKINEIFVSIDGEVNKWGQGGFTTFIRLAGCNLKCDYCDTLRAQQGTTGKEMTINDVIKEVYRNPISKITITGGEPLLQSKTRKLIEKLLSQGCKVSLETNGTIHPPIYNNNTNNFSVVIDYKLQFKEVMVFDPSLLTKNDYIKIVIGSVDDYLEAKGYILSINTKARIYLSPVFGKVDPVDLVKQLKNDKLFHVGLNCQIHKLCGLK